MNSDYREYLDKWMSGLEDELIFWNDYMVTKGDIYSEEYNQTVELNKKFVLENDIDEQYFGKDFNFIDVGSGPFSRCGRITDKVNMVFTAVDPLAEAYNALKIKNDVNNGIEIETAFVELLGKKYNENTFDMVHMSNSLDHCFDAMYGIYQLIYICKIGGKIILRHTENEAERSEYNGLHQWNLSVHNGENSFVIWGKDKRYDVVELLKEYVDFYIYPDISEGDWVFNKVVMIKKKKIQLPDINYYDDMLSSMYSFLLKYMISNLKVCNKDLIIHNRDAIRRINKAECINLPDNCTVDIYGLGVVGKTLIDRLETMRCSINNVYDMEKRKYKEIESIKLEDSIIDPENIVIISVERDNKEICEQLIKCGYKKEKIFTIDMLLEE